MMCSAARLDYLQAQNAINGMSDREKTMSILETVLKPLWVAYDALKRGRDSRLNRWSLICPERKLLLKPDGTVYTLSLPIDWMPTN